MPPLAKLLPHAVLALLVAASLGIGAAAAAVTPLPDGKDDFNTLGFTVRHAWVRFALAATAPFRDDLSRAEEDALVGRFFELNARITEQERIASDATASPGAAAAARAESAALRDERERIENQVEDILAARVAAVADDLGLTRHYGADVVWPPPSFEFADPPSVLIVSPRSEIRVSRRTLLQGDIPVQRREQLEAGAERTGDVSALVVQIGGIAMYPAIVPPVSDYRSAMRNLAHEWMHHYLFFAPLGRSYNDSPDLRTLNETVAGIVGDELGDAIVAAYPLQPQYVVRRAPAPAQQPPPPVDFNAEMRRLRIEVDALLAAGQVEEAERIMEQRRAFLAENGYYIRKINQAYFAFHGAYADSPGATDPIGPKLLALRARSASLADFVETARALTSVPALDGALD
ncbi:MAG TPA: hypothetical protein VNM91_03630 [Dehalococcoidia bacterium]|nr:hypothetical protein [Dehalococcoidia bacterium]